MTTLFTASPAVSTNGQLDDPAAINDRILSSLQEKKCVHKWLGKKGTK
jgi:hypothetical protein